MPILGRVNFLTLQYQAMAEPLAEFMRLNKIIMLNAEELGPEARPDYIEFATRVEKTLRSIAEYEVDKGYITDRQERACENMIIGVRKWAVKLDIFSAG